MSDSGCSQSRILAKLPPLYLLISIPFQVPAVRLQRTSATPMSVIKPIRQRRRRDVDESPKTASSTVKRYRHPVISRLVDAGSRLPLRQFPAVPQPHLSNRSNAVRP